MHRVVVENDDELERQVAENPVEEIVKSAPAQQQNAPQVQAQPVQVTQSVAMSEEQRIFGSDEDAKKLFENPEGKKVFT